VDWRAARRDPYAVGVQPMPPAHPPVGLGSTPGLRGALIWGAALAAYGNCFNVLHGRLSGRPRVALAWTAPLALLAGTAGCHRYLDHGSLALLGVHRRWLWRDAGWGAAWGAAMAALPALWFRAPRRDRPAVQADELRVGLAALLVRLFVVTPVLVALAEEVAFRGFLQGKLQRALPGRPAAAVALSSLAFGLWHVTVNVQTLRRTNVLRAGLASLPVALAGGLAGVCAAGAVFGALFYRTGSLVAPVVAHWLVDALLLIALYEWRGPGRQTRRR
jgi:membrane protease YdiL (CAAX protease family)